MEKNRLGESFKNSFLGVAKPSAHGENAKMRGGHMFLMILIVSLLSALGVGLVFSSLHDEVDKNWSRLPAFTYADGQLSVEESLFLPMTENTSTPTLFIIKTDVDDSLDSAEKQSMMSDALKALAEEAKCSQVLFLGRSHVIVWANWRMQGFAYTDLASAAQTLDNESARPIVHTLLSYFIVFIGIFVFVGMIGIYYLSLLIYALAGLIFNAVFGAKAEFGEIYKISMSAAFPVWILKSVLNMTQIGTITSNTGKICRVLILAYIAVALMIKGRLNKEGGTQSSATMQGYQNDSINTQVYGGGSYMGGSDLSDNYRV